jgi:general secretion pathway protein J
MKPRFSSGPRSVRRAGITLIEVMVAMTIIAIVMTLMYTGFSQTSRTKKRIETEIDRHHEVRMGLERMARELSMAFVSVQPLMNPDQSLVVVKTAFIGKEAGKGSRIDFASFSHQRLYRDAHESDQNELSYYLTDDPDDSSITVLARREQARIDDDPESGGRTQILIRDVEEFTLEFLEPLTGEWLSSWDTTQVAMQPNRLPSQVRIVVKIPSSLRSGTDLVFATRAILPMQYALNHSVYMGQ